MAPKLVASGIAADEVGVDRRTLERWAQEGSVTPALKTIGGHLRWDLADLRRQLNEWRPRPEQ